MNKEKQDKKQENIPTENQEITSKEENQCAANSDTSTENIAECSGNLEAKLAEANDKYMRLAAEFDNYRKRTLKERMDIMKYGGEDVIKELLPVLDDLDRNAEAMAKTDDIGTVREGISLIQQKLVQILTQKGLAEVDAQGLDLDTDLHDAITTIPAPTPELKGKILDVVQKGYKLSDKIIRHAKVVVGE